MILESFHFHRAICIIDNIYRDSLSNLTIQYIDSHIIDLNDECVNIILNCERVCYDCTFILTLIIYSYMT